MTRLDVSREPGTPQTRKGMFLGDDEDTQEPWPDGQELPSVSGKPLGSKSKAGSVSLCFAQTLWWAGGLRIRESSVNNAKLDAARLIEKLFLIL